GSGGEGDRSAAVSRFDAQGQLLSTDAFLCAGCTTSLALAIDLLPDGGAAVGGASADSQPGFFARYDAGGNRRLWVDAEIDMRYSRLAHDDHGAIYAIAESTAGAPAQIRRIDPASGSVAWAVPASEFAASADGIVAIRRADTGVVAVGIAGDGSTRWTTPLSPHAATFSRPFGAEIGRASCRERV